MKFNLAMGAPSHRVTAVAVTVIDREFVVCHVVTRKETTTCTQFRVGTIFSSRWRTPAGECQRTPRLNAGLSLSGPTGRLRRPDGTAFLEGLTIARSAMPIGRPSF